MSEALAFIHIPKTAGTSFRSAAASWFGVERCCFDYGLYSPQTDELARHWMLERREPAEFRARFDAQGLRFFAGHVDASSYVDVFERQRMVSFVRDPLQRIASEYQFFRRYFKEEQDFPTFFRQPRFINRQSQMLGGLDWARLGFVGQTERYESSLELLNRQFGFAIPALAENIGRDRREDEHPLTPEERHELETLNAADIELYRQVVTQLDWRLRLQQRSQEFVPGALESVAGGQVKGWIRPPAGRESVAIDVLVGRRPHCRVSAGAASTQAGRHSPVGFSAALPAVSPGTRVHCLVSASGQPLAGSPLVT